jgi:uncharacterized protein (DUF362 family)
VKRRSFLQFLAADAALPLAQRLALGSGPYQVGAGVSSDPYGATQRAITASGQFPAASIAGQTVMIKPNLVEKQPSTSGATTDPQVVRAVVDLALAAGAAQVLIVEGGIGLGANFDACGYDIFNGYNPQVQLMDFATQPLTCVRVPNGLTYFGLWLPTPAVQPNIVFISVGKMKTHVNATVSLSMKNIFGLASPACYYIKGQLLGRMDGHVRGIDESVVDVNLTRPISFSVIDGIWAMEGNGPLSGTPIQTNVVFAGLNPVAVDRVALNFMQIPQTAVPHLLYANLWGLGPADTSAVTVLGDSFTPVPFVHAQVAPTVWRPSPKPNTISLSAGQQTTIRYTSAVTCNINVDIIQDSDIRPGITVVRTLQSYASTPEGINTIQWDGRDDNGAQVAPGVYLVRLMATLGQGIGYATAYIIVNP